MHLLLDNNVFRSLTQIGRQGDLPTFLKEVRTTGLVDPTDKLSLAMTPFSLLEAIGVVPPNPTISLPAALVDGVGQEEEICDCLLKQAFLFLEQCPDMSEQRLLEKAQEQRLYTKNDVLVFFDETVVGPLKQPDAYRHIIRCVAIDALFKYPFSNTLAPNMQVQFLTLLFSRSEVDNAASLFRVMKRLWDNVYSPMYSDKASFDHQYVTRASEQMRLKNDRDYLDCDLGEVARSIHAGGPLELEVSGAFTS